MSINPEYKSVGVGELRRNPWNSNQVAPENETKIRASIERNGIFKPIIVREVAGLQGYEIIGGQHRWEQAVELGHGEVPIVNLGPISEIQAKEIGVIDNARYGADDTGSLVDILKEIGAGEIQDFLPYGQTDIDALFSASDIDLDELELDESFEVNSEERDETDPDLKPEAQPKTHALMRFKVPIADSERITALIAKAKSEQGFTKEDDLTNAGDALVYLLLSRTGGSNA